MPTLEEDIPPMIPDEEGLIRWLENDTFYGNRNRIEYNANCTTGAAYVVARSNAAAGVAISNIGKTEVTLVLTCSTADEASHNGLTFTLNYVDQDGAARETTATGTATLFNTPVAFNPAASDVYAVTSFTASADFDTRDIIAKVAAGKTYATITAAGAVTAATEAQLMGVGDLYGRSASDHADGVGKIQYIKYLTPWGTIKYGHCTHGADSTDEVRFFEATYTAGYYDSDNAWTAPVWAATTTTVKDFYRLRWHIASAAPTANSGEFYLTDADCSNVDGSGNDVYGIIDETYYNGGTTLHMCPSGYATWVVAAGVNLARTAEADIYRARLVYKKNGLTQNLEINDIFSTKFTFRPFRIDADSECYIQLLDTGNASIAGAYLTVIEVEDA